VIQGLAVRIRGGGHKGGGAASFVDIKASVALPPPEDKHKPTKDTPSNSSITFALPEAAKLNGIEPTMNGKDKMFFVDISVDGGVSFDKAEVPKLQIKL
jgi:hypothetical protein